MRKTPSARALASLDTALAEMFRPRRTSRHNLRRSLDAIERQLHSILTSSELLDQDLRAMLGSFQVLKVRIMAAYDRKTGRYK